MKTKYNVLSEPVKILKKLQRFGYSSAIIAGGAIRDDYTGKTINDYDIFLWDPRQSSEFLPFDTKHRGPRMDFESAAFEQERTAEFIDLLETLEIDQIFAERGYGPLTGDGDKLDAPGIGAKLTAIWEAELEYNQYQLIYTISNPVTHVEKYFDIGLCKAYCDGVKIRYTPDFLKDVQNGTFTIVGQDMSSEQFAYAVEYHADKLMWKYPNFRIVAAPHNQKLYDEYYKITS